MKNLLLIISILITFSCSKDNVDYSYPDDPENKRKSRAGKFFQDDIILYGKKVKADDAKIKNKLFLSAKSVIVELIEIDVADPDLGIISTKWQGSKKSKEKTKITVLVKGSKVKEDNLHISIHKKYLDKDNKWQNKKSENEDFLIKLLKGKILDRAK